MAERDLRHKWQRPRDHRGGDWRGVAREHLQALRAGRIPPEPPYRAQRSPHLASTWHRAAFAPLLAHPHITSTLSTTPPHPQIPAQSTAPGTHRDPGAAAGGGGPPCCPSGPCPAYLYVVLSGTRCHISLLWPPHKWPGLGGLKQHKQWFCRPEAGSQCHWGDVKSGQGCAWCGSSGRVLP